MERTSLEIQTQLRRLLSAFPQLNMNACNHVRVATDGDSPALLREIDPPPRSLRIDPKAEWRMPTVPPSAKRNRVQWEEKWAEHPVHQRLSLEAVEAMFVSPYVFHESWLFAVYERQFEQWSVLNRAPYFRSVFDLYDLDDLDALIRLCQE